MKIAFTVFLIWASLAMSSLVGLARHIAWAIEGPHWFWGALGVLASPIGIINGWGVLLGLWG